MRIAVLVSGGVDSSLALHRTVEAARGTVTGYYLKIWLEDEMQFLGSCPWEEDLEYARAVCAAVAVPLEVVPLQRQYYDRVVAYTVAELRAGRTPSPDIFCNQRIKFGAFLDAIGGAADVVVSGHYAQKEYRDGLWHLLRAVDPVKDQTYFLSQISQEQLARAEFPIGDLTKAEVRVEAARRNLANQNRPDSQGICFLGKIRYPDFVRHYLGERRGAIVEWGSGTVLGHHPGSWFYTIGQRQGLGLGNGPWYVIEKSIEENTVWVAHARDEVAYRSFEALDPHWIAGPRARDRAGERLLVRIRHGPALIGALVEDVAATETNAARLRITLDRPDRGVAPGQFVVLYDDQECLGAAMIGARRSMA